MRKIKKVWQGFCDESLEAKIRYMPSLFLQIFSQKAPEFIQGLPAGRQG